MPTTQSFTNIYDLDYFNGATCFIFIGDVWIDEITSLQYQTSQQKRPIYGYASQLFDVVAAGQVIVQGSFTINYKEQGYLWAVLRRYFQVSEVESKLRFLQSRGRKLSDMEKQRKRRDDALLRLGPTSQRPLLGSNGTEISRASIERLIRGDATTSERYEFYHGLAGYASFDVDSPKDKIFEDIVEVFENQLWEPDVKNSDLNSQIRRTDDSRFDSFDMYITFGDFSNPRANATAQKITGVHLLSQGKQVSLDTSPIQEQYDFFARSVV